MQKTYQLFPYILIGLSSILLTFTTASAYERSPTISIEQWEQLSPYFLPEDSPQKAVLDRIFSKKRVLRSEEAMRKAGFLTIAPPRKKVVVCRHYKLRGYLVKALIDHPNDSKWAGVNEGEQWKKRCDGAKILQESILRHGYQDIMKVPKKWIYPLPEYPSSKKDHVRRNFIMLVEDMYALSYYKNHEAYKKKMTPQLLDALFVMMRENLLYDSVHPSNAPFCKDGKIAFLDTEFVNYTLHEMPYDTLTHDLSRDMQNYWTNLIQNNGPQK